MAVLRTPRTDLDYVEGLDGAYCRRLGCTTEKAVQGEADMEKSLRAPAGDDILSKVLYRQLASTYGQRIALIPASTRKGDRIAVLFGGQVLYVVRPLQDSRGVCDISGGSKLCETHGSVCNEYEFVGDCYVHCLMDGEAVRAQWDHLVVDCMKFV